MKKESKVANSSENRKDSLVKLSMLVLFSKGLSAQMLIVSSNGILVNKDSISKLVIQFAQSKKEVSLSWKMKNKSFIVKSFDLNSVNKRTRDLTSLYDGAFIAERMGWREGHRFITGSGTLTIPYNIPEREPQG